MLLLAVIEIMMKSDIKIAIHQRVGSFSDRWIEYCDMNSISYQIVNCMDDDIIQQLENFDVLLWNWPHMSRADLLTAPYIINAAESMGLKVFPSTKTCFTFDNKIAQKFQFEAINAPLVQTSVFYDKQSALEWIGNADFPLVFKLSKGAGAMNVKLLRNKDEAIRLINKAFSQGFKPSGGHLKENLGKLKNHQTRRKFDFLGKIKRLPATLKNINYSNKMMGLEIGYVYFQKFVPDLTCDTRVVIVGDRAFAFRRDVRPDDFRASGSGFVDDDPKNIDLDFIKIGFDVARKLSLQCVAFDFVKGSDGQSLILESSYTFPAASHVKDCPGYWTSDLKWNSGHCWPQDTIIDSIMKEFVS